MSDPVTNIPTEDLLSSVRRLLSQGAQSGEDRLMLTPDFRVGDRPAAPEHTQTDKAETQDLSRILRAHEDDADPVPLHLLLKEMKAQETIAQQVPPVPAPPIKAENQPDPRRDGVKIPRSWEEKDDEDDTEFVGALIDAVVGKLANKGNVSEPKTKAPAAEINPPPAPKAKPEPVPNPDTVATPEAQKAESRTRDLEEKVAALEALVQRGTTPPVIDWEDHAAKPQNPTVPEQAAFDETRLREMVAQTIRQELQGVLGERITRNVRKLVRREINRALLDHS